MSEIISITPQVRFLTIFQSAQQKLQKNLQIIVDKLEQQEKLIKKNEQKIGDVCFEYKSLFEKSENNLYENKLQTFEQLGRIKQSIIKMENKEQELQETLLQYKGQNREMAYRMDGIQNSMKKQKIQQIKQSEKIKNQLLQITIQINKLNKQLSQKQNRTQAQQTRNKLENLQKILNKACQNIKYIQFRLEKVDVNFQKNQNNQKKQLQRINKMGQDIKKQLRNSVNMKQSDMDKLVEYNDSDDINIIRKIRKNNSTNSQFNRSQFGTKDLQINFKPHHQKLLNILNDKVTNIQKKFDDITTKVVQNSIQRGNNRPKTENITNNMSEIQQKINSIRPQMIKIWSKIDTVDERSTYIDKKLQQKSKQISYILEQFKQSNFSKIDDRIKAYQTELYANLKEIKTKLDLKASNLDFEKQMKNVDDRCQILGEQILMKSDKVQVKKALLFLESKIKEIILVISQDQQNEREALITKKQLKCISCDKQVEKLLANTNGTKQNWDNLPQKELIPETLGRFGMTSFGTMNKKIKRLQNKELPILNRKNYYKRNSSQHIESLKQNA